MTLRGMLDDNFVMQFDPLPILEIYNAYRQMKGDMQDAEFDSYLQKEDPTLFELEKRLGKSLNPVLCIISIQPSKVFN